MFERFSNYQIFKCILIDLYQIATWPQDYEKKSPSAQLSTKFFLLIDIKMPTIIGILTFMSRKTCILALSEPSEI